MKFTEPLNDCLDAACCTGSAYVLRYEALRDIGGLPLAPCGEDIVLSALLSRAGWKVAFIREELQFGLGPGSFLAYVKQRMRWVSRQQIFRRDAAHESIDRWQYSCNKDI